MPTAESTSTDFSFDLQFVGDDEQVVRNQPIARADFGHAIRATSFEAYRVGVSDSYVPEPGRVRVKPLFNDGTNSPTAKGFTVEVHPTLETEHRCEFGISYFGSIANRERAAMLRASEMTENQELYYRLQAFLDDAVPAPVENKLAVSLGPPTYNLEVASGERSAMGSLQPWDQPSGDDLPVVIEQPVLQEAVDEARSFPEREIAGFLLGRLTREPDSGELFVAVTGLASSASTTEATATSVTYTPQSFAHVREIVKLRNCNESIVGWYHSHPFKLCAECPIPTPKECIEKVLFYSQDDVHLMETTFEQPFMVGLLVACEPRIEEAIGHLPAKLYGWQRGEIKPRGFDVATR